MQFVKEAILPTPVMWGLIMLYKSKIYSFNEWEERLFLPQDYTVKGSLLTWNPV